MNFQWQPGISLEEIERNTIISALKFYQGNRTHAAGALKIALRTLTNKITKYREQGFTVPPPSMNGVVQAEEL